MCPSKSGEDVVGPLALVVGCNNVVCGVCAAFKRLDVITGKGLHSVGNVARILQAVIQFVEEEGMTYYQKPGKDGVMIHLADTGQPSGQPSMSLNGYG